jgi:transposase
VPHTDPADPPRRRANKTRGHGSWDNDRPPVCGVVGRDGGEARLSVEGHTDAATLNRVVRDAVTAPALVNTDDWRGYGRLAEVGCARAVVRHTEKEWARDDDGDGVREVHTNTQEGQWTGLRNFLRPFRGVNKVYLHQYVALFEWGHNIKRVTPRFIRALLGVPLTTTDIPP